MRTFIAGPWDLSRSNDFCYQSHCWIKYIAGPHSIRWLSTTRSWSANAHTFDPSQEISRLLFWSESKRQRLSVPLFQNETAPKIVPLQDIPDYKLYLNKRPPLFPTHDPRPKTVYWFKILPNPVPLLFTASTSAIRKPAPSSAWIRTWSWIGNICWSLSSSHCPSQCC